MVQVDFATEMELYCLSNVSRPMLRYPFGPLSVFNLMVFDYQSHLDTRAIRNPVVFVVVLALLRLTLHLEAPLEDPRNDVVVAATADPTWRRKCEMSL